MPADELECLERVYDLLAPRQRLCGLGCKAQHRSNSRAIARICNAADYPQSLCPAGLERNRAISARCLLLAPRCKRRVTRFELIPIALQRGGVEIVNTFLEVQRQLEHVLVLHPALPQRRGVVLQKEVALDVGNAKANALIKQQLVAKTARAHRHLRHA